MGNAGLAGWWERSAGRDGPSLGRSPFDASHGASRLRPAGAPLGQSPLLVQCPDAHQVASVQVHPDDERGRRLANDNGKTEAWVVVHAEPGSAIYSGLVRGVTRLDFASALDQGEVEP